MIAISCGVYSTPQAVIIDGNGQLFFRGNYNKTLVNAQATKKLLAQSSEQQEVLQQQEEEMRQSMEELNTTKEEMEGRMDDYKEKIREPEAEIRVLKSKL